MSRCPIHHQADPARHLLGGRHLHDGDSPIFERRASTFGEGVLGVNLVEMLLHHEVDARAGVAFLAGLGEKDQIAVQNGARALRQQHDHQVCRQLVLVVSRAAPPDVAVLEDRAERVHRPLLALDTDHVGVSHEQNRPLAAVAFDTRDQVRAGRIQREGLHRYAFRLEHSFQVVDHEGLIARRIAGVDLDERAVVAQDLGLLLFPVDVGALRGSGARK